MHLRHDALAAAAEWITMVETSVARAASADEPGLVATVGTDRRGSQCDQCHPWHGRGESRSSAHVESHPKLLWTSQLLEEAEIAAQKRGIGLESVRKVNEPAVEMDRASFFEPEAGIEAAGFPSKTMPSGAGHDAMVMATRVPTAMLFLRSPGGISHHPAETVREEDVEAALHVGRRFLERLAAESDS